MDRDFYARIQECLDRAAECDRWAATAHDPLAKQTFVEAAKWWRELGAVFSTFCDGAAV